MAPDSESSSTTSSGTSGLFRVRRGSGEPLLLIQGIAAHHGMWGEPFLRELERDFDVVIYDHRGIGRSPRADVQFTIGDLAEDAAQLLVDQGWSDAHVLGISMGGMIAQELALRHPERVRTLMLGCTTPAAALMSGATGPPRVVAAISTGDAELSTRVGFEANVSPAYAAVAGRYEAFREIALSEKVPPIVVQMQAVACLGHDVRGRLSSVATSTLVLHGQQDDMIPHDAGEALAELIPDARFDSWADVGHLFWWEQPERSADAVRRHTHQ